MYKGDQDGSLVFIDHESCQVSDFFRMDTDEELYELAIEIA